MNSTSRYYLEKSAWTDDSLTLQGDEAHHCSRVLRAKIGDLAEVFDGEGSSVIGKITELGKDAVTIALTEQPVTTIRQHKVSLFQAIPKGGNMELIVQKSVELSIAEIQPLITQNTVARSEQLEKKQAKWQRIALEACKQCGQNYLPKILPPMSYEDWINAQQNKDPIANDLNIVAALHPDSVPLRKAFENSTANPAGANLLVGPEGDFSEHEYTQAISIGFQPISLGDIILRVETATLFCISVIKYELEKSNTK